MGSDKLVGLLIGNAALLLLALMYLMYEVAQFLRSAARYLDSHRGTKHPDKSG